VFMEPHIIKQRMIVFQDHFCIVGNTELCRSFAFGEAV
jgi:hypothetical protein